MRLPDPEVLSQCRSIGSGNIESLKSYTLVIQVIHEIAPLDQAARENTVDS